MGFWTDKDKENENKDNEGKYEGHVLQRYKQCTEDPEDTRFLLCKDVVERVNSKGAIERIEGKEERLDYMAVMKNASRQAYDSMIDPFFNSIVSQIANATFPPPSGQIGGGPASDLNFFDRMKQSFWGDSNQQNIFQENPLNNQQQNSSRVNRSSTSSSSSRRCEQDKEDASYMICKTTTKRVVNGEQSVEESEERIKKGDPIQSHPFYAPQNNGLQGNQQNPMVNSFDFTDLARFMQPGHPFQQQFHQQQQPQQQYASSNTEQTTRAQNNQDVNLNMRNSTNSYSYPEFQTSNQKKSEVYDL